MATLTIALNNPFTKILLPVPETLDFDGLEIIVPKGGMLLSGNTSVVRLSEKLRQPPGHFELLISETAGKK